MKLPKYENSLPVNKFKKFLVNCGGQLLHETNEYEVIRVLTDSGVLILYRKQDGLLTWPKELVAAYMAYKSGGAIKWRATRKKKVNRKRGSVLVKTLQERDGPDCWFCGGGMPLPTIEHLLNVSNGGNNHINNLVLAHERCNQRAASMCISDKVKLREHLREGTAATALM